MGGRVDPIHLLTETFFAEPLRLAYGAFASVVGARALHIGTAGRSAERNLTDESPISLERTGASTMAAGIELGRGHRIVNKRTRHGDHGPFARSSLLSGFVLAACAVLSHPSSALTIR